MSGCAAGAASAGCVPEEGEDGPERRWGASWARGISLFCSWVVHCSLGPLSAAAVTGSGIARVAVVKAQRYDYVHLWLLVDENTWKFQDVFCT